MPYHIDRVEPRLYFCLWTGLLKHDEFLQSGKDRAALATQHGDDPYVFVLEVRDIRLDHWDLNKAREVAEIKPTPLMYILVTDNTFVQLSMNLIRLFVKVETQPTREKALERGRQLLRTFHHAP